MFQRRRDDTQVKTIEREYGVDLRARGDMKLATLLEERGFESLTQFLKAYHGRLTAHARRRRIFISFHKEDQGQRAGLTLMSWNRNVDISFYDVSLKERIKSENLTYVRSKLRDLIGGCSVVVCLVGNGTAWREWVDWELSTAVRLGKGICGVRLKGTYGRFPAQLTRIGALTVEWEPQEIVRAIECAAARRS
jgi:hypothetical protein